MPKICRVVGIAVSKDGYKTHIINVLRDFGMGCLWRIKRAFVTDKKLVCEGLN